MVDVRACHTMTKHYHWNQHDTDMLWIKFQSILPLYIRRLAVKQKRQLCVQIPRSNVLIPPNETHYVLLNIGQYRIEYLNSAETIVGAEDVPQVSALITFWITIWQCAVILLWEKLWWCKHTGLINSYELLIMGPWQDKRQLHQRSCPILICTST